jgi:hypothetical protein
MGIETEQEKRDRHPRQDDIDMVMRRLDDPERDALERIIAAAHKEGMSAKPQPTKPRKTPDDLMTMSEAAAQARIGVKTFKGHVARGAVRYVILGLGTKRPRKRIAPADLTAFIEAQTRKDVACPSTEPRARRTGNFISGGEVIAFTAQPRPRPGAKPKK